MTSRFLASCLVLLLLAPGALAANDADGDSVDDRMEARTERKVTARALPTTPASLYVRSESQGAAVDDAFEVVWSKGALHLTYLPDASDAEAVSVVLELAALVEFVDEDADGVVDPNERIASVDLGEAEEGTLDVASAPDGGRLVTHRTDLGVVAVEVEVASRFAASGARALAPVEVLVTILVEDYAFEEDDSRLSLLAGLDLGPSASVGGFAPPPGLALAASEHAVGLKSGNRDLYLTWAESVDSGPVAASLPLGSAPGRSEIAFVYPRDATFAHALRLGVASEAYAALAAEPPAASPLPVYLAALALVGAAVAGTAFLRARRRP